MIKKAVIAAAGRGTRFLPVTKAYPKELLPILNKPTIQLIIEELIGAGITEIAIVHLHGNPAIKRYFTKDQEFEDFLQKVSQLSRLESLKRISKKVSFRFIPQPRNLPYGTGAPILAAKNFIGQDPFVYCYGDDLIQESKSGDYLTSMVKVFEKHRATAVLGAQKMPRKEVVHYATVRLKEKSKIPFQVEALEEKLPAKRALSELVIFGRFVASPLVLETLKKQTTQRREFYFYDGINPLLKDNLILAHPVNSQGKWLTTGTPEAWLQANQAFQRLGA